MMPTSTTGLTIVERAWVGYQREQALADSRALRLLYQAHGGWVPTTSRPIERPPDAALRAWWHHRGRHLAAARGEA